MQPIPTTPSRDHPIIFVHGLIGTLPMADLSPFLTSARVLAPDLLGYGVHSSVSPADIDLAAQLTHLSATIEQCFGDEPVHLVGHSVGGAIAALFAHRFPERVHSIVSVEGNFTLQDAFWSASVAAMTDAQAHEMLEQFRAQPAAWLARSGIAPQPHFVEVAAQWLAHQPASTVRAMAASVVAETGAADYTDKLRRVFLRHRVHLIAGARSRAGWDVPDWAFQDAASIAVLPDCGHMMMLEQPEAFAHAVTHALSATVPAITRVPHREAEESPAT